MHLYPRRRNVAAKVAEELKTVTYATPPMEECRKKRKKYNIYTSSHYHFLKPPLLKQPFLDFFLLVLKEVLHPALCKKITNTLPAMIGSPQSESVRVTITARIKHILPKRNQPLYTNHPKKERKIVKGCCNVLRMLYIHTHLHETSGLHTCPHQDYCQR